jgi:hypothetical protein
VTVIRDSRTMHGGRPLKTVEDLENFWVEWAQNRGQTVTRKTNSLDAYVNDGRWVADCPCGGGIACWSEYQHGFCGSCCTVYMIRFPDAEDVATAEVLLSAREPDRRHWDPTAQTVDDLKVENATRALPFVTGGDG